MDLDAVLSHMLMEVVESQVDVLQAFRWSGLFRNLDGELVVHEEGVGWRRSRSVSIRRSQSVCCTADVAVMYSASQVDKAWMDCFF